MGSFPGNFDVSSGGHEARIAGVDIALELETLGWPPKLYQHGCYHLFGVRPPFLEARWVLAVDIRHVGIFVMGVPRMAVLRMGVFRVRDTHMVVGRGLGCGLPVRYFCPPEIATVALHPGVPAHGRAPS